jgi:hypothetical protein|tara:strand:+ start:4541 stop:4918 length:378 start_codon:yes stop_codon:yes gene_type:complete
MDYESKFEELKGKLEAAILEAIWVPNELLPERYHENREGGSTLKRINRIYDAEVAPKVKDPRGESVVISDGVVMSDNPERLAILNQYRDAAEAEKEIPYQINEHKLYRNEQAFAVAMELELEEEE